MGRRKGEDAGLLSLEACIAVTIFIFLMLFLYSFFVVFEVRNEIGHTVLSTASSMSLDIYENKSLGDSDTVGQILFNLYGAATNSNNDFTDYRIWSDSAVVTDAYGNTSLSADFDEVIKNRFIAYLTSGDSSKADEILGRYHVKGGVDGLDFSGSYVSDGKLYLSVKYEVEYEFQVFGLGTLKFEQSACSKIWQ